MLTTIAPRALLIPWRRRSTEPHIKALVRHASGRHGEGILGIENGGALLYEDEEEESKPENGEDSGDCTNGFPLDEINRRPWKLRRGNKGLREG